MITVSGLLTGGDIEKQLKGKNWEIPYICPEMYCVVERICSWMM